MKTMTMDCEHAEPMTDDVILSAASTDDLDPDFPIEATGGPLDSGGRPHSGPTPPPAC